VEEVGVEERRICHFFIFSFLRFFLFRFFFVKFLGGLREFALLSYYFCFWLLLCLFESMGGRVVVLVCVFGSFGNFDGKKKKKIKKKIFCCCCCC